MFIEAKIPILIFKLFDFFFHIHIQYFQILKCLILFTDMRRDVQEIYRNTPHGKQVMMFSATLSKDIRPVCKKFMQDVNTYYLHEIPTPA